MGGSLAIADMFFFSACGVMGLGRYFHGVGYGMIFHHDCWHCAFSACRRHGTFDLQDVEVSSSQRAAPCLALVGPYRQILLVLRSVRACEGHFESHRTPYWLWVGEFGYGLDCECRDDGTDFGVTDGRSVDEVPDQADGCILPACRRPEDCGCRISTYARAHDGCAVWPYMTADGHSL